MQQCSQPFLILDDLPLLVLWSSLSCPLRGQMSLSSWAVSCWAGLELLAYNCWLSVWRLRVCFYRFSDFLSNSVVLVDWSIIVKRICCELVLVGVLIDWGLQVTCLYLWVIVNLRSIKFLMLFFTWCHIDVVLLRILPLHCLTLSCYGLDNWCRKLLVSIHGHHKLKVHVVLLLNGIFGLV
jgi:hypothetical protein